MGDIRGKDLANEKYTGKVWADDANGTGYFLIQNVLGNFAEKFVPSTESNPTTTVAGKAYMYKDLLYVAKVSGYQGPWDASKFTQKNASEIFVNDFYMKIFEGNFAGDFSVFPHYRKGKIVSVNGVFYEFDVDHFPGDFDLSEVTPIPLEKFCQTSALLPFINKFIPVVGSSNWLTTTGATEECYVNYVSGNIASNASFIATDYLPIIGGKTYYMKNCKAGYQVAFYDVNKSFISGVLLDSNVSSKSFDVPEGAAFARYSLSVEYASTNYVVLNNNVTEKEDYSFVGYKLNFDDVFNVEGKIKIKDFNFMEKIEGNLFDASKVIEGYFVNTSGNVQANSSYCYYTFAVPANTTVSFIYCHIIEFKDAQGNHITNSGTAYEPYTTARTITTPATAAFCSVSIPISYKGNTVFVVGAQDRVNPAPPVFSTLKFPKKLSSEIIVAKDGSGDFTSLTEAVKVAKDGDIIHVCAGVYDNEEVECWNKTIRIEGEGPDCTIIKNGLNTYSRPPIEMASGTLKDIQFWSYGTDPSLDSNGWSAYAMHVESNILANNYLYCENVIFHTAKGVGGVGMGMRGPCKVTFKGCHFIADNDVAFYAHDAANSSYAGLQELYLIDCLFSATGSYAVRLASEKVEGTTVKMTVVGCSFEDSNEIPAVRKYAEGSGTASGNTNIDLINWNITKLCHGNNISLFNYGE